jgi:paraquat-inducible protein B
MTNTPDGSPTPPEPDAPPVKTGRLRISIIWLVPFIAVVIGLSMLVHAWIHTGPTISISFKTAAGLSEGKTPVKYKDVTVGTVSSVQLSDDGTHVTAEVKLVESARSLANEQTRFWVVRPRLSAGGASGIDTLLSGAYIGVDRGSSDEEMTHFVGLESPPSVINGTPGKSFVLHAKELGSLDINSPVYFRRIQVGRIASYQLDPDGKHVTLQVFIDAPYDRFVTGDTRFWNASGVDIALNGSGLKVNTQSLATVLAGGVAFATPDGVNETPRAEYALAKDQQTAMSPPDGPASHIDLVFDEPLRGLSIGAPVVFSGRELGNVTSVELDYDTAKHRFPTLVGVDVFPQRLGRVLAKLPMLPGNSEQQVSQFLDSLVQHGLRAKVKAANLLTGQLYVSLDFIQDAPKVAFNPNLRPLVLPTVNTMGVDQLEDKLNHIADKIDKIPFDSIGTRLNDNLGDLDATLKQINGQFLPETTRTLQQVQSTLGSAQNMLSQDAPLQQNINQTLEEVQRSAQSIRSLTDYLERHPESLLRGRAPSLPSRSATQASPSATGANP